MNRDTYWTQSLKAGDPVILVRGGEKLLTHVVKLDGDGIVEIREGHRFSWNGMGRDARNSTDTLEPATPKAVEQISLNLARARVVKLWNEVLDTRFPNSLGKSDLETVEEVLRSLYNVLHKKPQPGGVL